VRTLTIADPALLAARRSFTDTFMRADNSTLGSPWIVRNLTFGITSNTGYYTGSVTSARAIATVDVGSANQVVEWDLSVWPKGPVECSFRYVDLNNFWYVGGSSSQPGTVVLVKKIAGSESVVATQTGVTWGVGTRLRVETSGEDIIVKAGGVTLSSLSTTSSDLATTGIHAGIGGWAAAATPHLRAARWSRFYCES